MSEVINDLLVIFNKKIADYGGAIKLANDIESEWLKYPKRPSIIHNGIYNHSRWSNYENRILVERYYDMNYESIGYILGRSERSISGRVSILLKSGQLKSKFLIKEK